MKIFKTTDKIPFSIGDVKIWISPMSFGHKVEIQSTTKLKGGVEVSDGFKVALLTLKYSVKEIEGVSNADGTPYQLEFEEDGKSLTDDCVNELFQLEHSPKVIRACNSFHEAQTNEAIKGLEGVTFDFAGVKTSKKKL